MAEAKESKLREYFTRTTHHTQIKPSDLSGDKLFVGAARCESSQRKDSPIRLNDTFRSNVVLGSDEQFPAVPGNSTPIRIEKDSDQQGTTTLGRQRSASVIKNVVIDQQEVQKQQYKDHTKSSQVDFKPHRRGQTLRSLTSTPTIREITAFEQATITRSNKERGQDCKNRCGLVGNGAKQALDHLFSAQLGSRLDSSGVQVLKKRNLDGEAGTLIRPEQLTSNKLAQELKPSQEFTFKQEKLGSKIGSIQKSFQKRNAFESSELNPLSRQYQTTRPSQQDDDIRSQKSSSSSQQYQTARFPEKKLIYDVEISPSKDLSNKDIFKMCAKADVITYSNSQNESQQETIRVKFRDSTSDQSKANKIIDHLKRIGCHVDLKSKYESATPRGSESGQQRLSRQSSNQEMLRKPISFAYKSVRAGKPTFPKKTQSRASSAINESLQGQSGMESGDALKKLVCFNQHQNFCYYDVEPNQQEGPNESALKSVSCTPKVGHPVTLDDTSPAILDENDESN